MFDIMIVVMIFQMNTYFKIDQITHFKYVQFKVLRLYLNTFVKRKIVRAKGREIW